MVLAASALSKQAQNMALTVDDEPHQGAYFRSWTGAALDGREVRIGNRGQTPAQVVVTTSGQPAIREPAQAQGYQVEFDYRNFLRGDMAAQREFVKAMWGIGAYDIDECRAELGKNPLESGKGKMRLVPVNMVELGKEPKNAGTTPGN